LQIEFGELNLPLSKGPLKAADSTAATVGATPARAFTRQPAVPHSAPASAKEALLPTVQDDGMFPIVASMIGRFCLQPEPGAAPFVQVGSEVADNSTFGLIEVMKTFNADIRQRRRYHFGNMRAKHGPGRIRTSSFPCLAEQLGMLRLGER